MAVVRAFGASIFDSGSWADIRAHKNAWVYSDGTYVDPTSGTTLSLGWHSAIALHLMRIWNNPNPSPHLEYDWQTVFDKNPPPGATVTGFSKFTPSLPAFPPFQAEVTYADPGDPTLAVVAEFYTTAGGGTLVDALSPGSASPNFPIQSSAVYNSGDVGFARVYFVSPEGINGPYSQSSNVTF
jgi:hypothetical protein